jgi:hypothetical protein
LPISVLRSELQSWVRYMMRGKLARHSGRSEESGKRMIFSPSGERTPPTCSGRQLAGHNKDFLASCQKEQAGSPRRLLTGNRAN